MLSQCAHVQPLYIEYYYILGVGGIDKNSTFFEKIMQYYYIPTIGVADLQAPLNNMLRSS